jgi:predicted ATPase
MGQGLRHAGEFSEALALFDEALAFCEAHDSRYFQAEVRRQRAELLSDPSYPARDPELARRECLSAAADARKIDASWWQLASLLAALRLPLAPDPAAQEELRRLLIAFPLAPAEPPLLSEAREMAG